MPRRRGQAGQCWAGRGVWMATRRGGDVAGCWARGRGARGSWRGALDGSDRPRRGGGGREEREGRGTADGRGGLRSRCTPHGITSQTSLEIRI
ncbi:Protein of unknown function, partial [Gryllus bimaculatus]